LTSRKYAALFTRPSIRSKRSSAASAIARTEASSETSTSTAIAWPPPRSTSATVSSDGFRSAATTFAPCPPQPTANAWPMPVAAPVTMIVAPREETVCAHSVPLLSFGAPQLTIRTVTRGARPPA
jgi:hypothetical protein